MYYIYVVPETNEFWQFETWTGNAANEVLVFLLRVSVAAIAVSYGCKIENVAAKQNFAERSNFGSGLDFY